MKRFLNCVLIFVMFLLLIAGVGWAGTKYVDPLGTDDGAHGTTPGTGAWATISYAVTNATAGDTIQIANGNYGPYNQINISKALNLTGASEAGVVISFNAAQHGFYFSGTGANIFTNMTITAGGDATHRAIYLDGATNNTFIHVTVNNWAGHIFYSRTSATATFYYSTFSNNVTTTQTNLTFAASTITFYYPKFINNGNTSVGNLGIITNIGGTIVLNNPLFSGNICGLSGGCTLIACSSGSLTLNNPIISCSNYSQGASTAAITQSSTGEVTVNNPLINGSAFRPAIITAGTVTINNGYQNNFPSFKYPGFGEAIFSFACADVNHAASGNLLTYAAPFTSVGKKMTYYCDDGLEIGAGDTLNNIRTFVAAGHELACEPSSAARLDVLNPFYVRYVGANANPRVVIAYTSDTNCTVQCITDSGTDVSLQTGLGQSTPHIGNSTSDANSVLKAINDHADWVAATNYSGKSYYDDQEAYVLAAGTYTGVTVNTDILMDETRFLADCITKSKAALEALIIGGYTIKSFLYPEGFYSANAKALIKTDLMKSSLFQAMHTNPYNTLPSISDMYQLEPLTEITYIRGADWAGLDATQKEARVRGWCRSWADAAFTKGMWTIFIMPAYDTPMTASEITWMIDELGKLGVKVMGVAEASDYIAANYTASGDGFTKTPLTTDFSLKGGSVCAMTGTSTPYSGIANITDYAGKVITDGSGNVTVPWISLGAYQWIGGGGGLTPGLGLSGGNAPPWVRKRNQ